ncbi:MAG TPA: crossover junction endodeoxyribonuclease RuvC [Steroidobacteraceae bacterium]|jgi:crossover junction endodeoxyribonuclease RuvC|nr:crossover junction endodeoxyribonuclease RuvC [Steroidobacteraceae bacterium]
MSRYRTRSWRAFDPGAARTLPARAAGLRILGIDPGSRRTGYGVIERRGADWVHVAHGCVTVTATGESLSERLRVIFESLRELIATHVPGEVAIERVFVNRNVDSALKLGQARGAALCAVPKGLPVFEYAPRAIKLALVGSGAAEKAQVAHMIRTLLGLQGRISPDAADALAVAVCHAHSLRLYELVAQSEPGAIGAAAQPSR